MMGHRFRFSEMVVVVHEKAGFYCEQAGVGGAARLGVLG
jgi:hypothetical protein